MSGSFIRKGHGNGAGVPRVENPVPDELSTPSLAACQAAEAERLPRAKDGKIDRQATARALGAKGGRARARKAALVTALGLRPVASSEAWHVYDAAGRELLRATMADLAARSGGHVSAAVASLARAHAMQTAAASAIFDEATFTGDVAKFTAAARLSAEARSSLLAMTELHTREIEERGKRRGPIDPLAAWRLPSDGKALPAHAEEPVEKEPPTIIEATAVEAQPALSQTDPTASDTEERTP